MYTEHAYNATNRHTEVRLKLDDRELAQSLDPRLVLDDVRSYIVCEIGRAVMKRLGPAIDQALTDFSLNDPNVS